MFAHIVRSEEHTSELQSHVNLVCRLLLEKKKKKILSVFYYKKKKKIIIIVISNSKSKFCSTNSQIFIFSFELLCLFFFIFFFFFNDTATTEIYTLSLHDALPIYTKATLRKSKRQPAHRTAGAEGGDRKSTRLNSSHMSISYAVFCLKKKKKT